MSVPTPVTNNTFGDVGAQINNDGYIVWERRGDGPDSEIFLSRYAGSPIQITDNSYNDVDPQINDSGYVVWEGYDGSDWEIFVYDGENTTQITNNNYNDYDPQINDFGYIVWYGYDGQDNEIFLAIPSIVAAFCASPKSGPAPLSVDFTEQSTGDITSWNWDFGDGSTSAAQNPSHTYTDSGTYTVRLTVAGLQGSDTRTKTDYIKVGHDAKPLPGIPLLLLYD
ncbi:PKD domain-containing protein [bacterium]|nr:PKD domain-containing protein [bacterium]